MRWSCLPLLLISAPAMADVAMEGWVPHSAAQVTILDKLRAQPTKLTLRKGQPQTYGTLTITLRNCLTRPADEPENAAAAIDIADRRGTVAEFHGWLFSNTPAVSQYEHPVYDLRLAGCQS